MNSVNSIQQIAVGPPPARLHNLQRLVKNDLRMSQAEQPGVWLEGDGREQILEGNCSIGRARLNTIVLESPKVSRLHAIIHHEDAAAFWLVDLGSSNGTFLNKRRIHEPVRLRDRDQITIGGMTFTFRQPADASEKPRITVPLVTLQEQIEDAPCWLLVADIKDFTPLSRRLVSDELATLVSAWLASCKEIIEQHGGVVNKYLGDGILAYWHDGEHAVADVLAVISALQEAQKRAPQFRFVIHFGSVAIGGVSSLREETLMGSEVNLAFRLEKLAGSLNESCGVSDTARKRLGNLRPCRDLGEHELKGFEGKRRFFAV